MAWYDYLAEKAYQTFFEKPRFERATEPPRKTAQEQAYERFRGVEQRLQPAARPPSAEPKTSGLERLMGMAGQIRERGQAAMVEPEIPLVEPGPDASKERQRTHLATTLYREISENLRAGKITEEQAQKDWDGVPELVWPAESTEAKRQATRIKLPLGLGTIPSWATVPLEPGLSEEQTAFIKKVPIAGEVAEPHIRGLTSPAGILGTALFPELTAGMVGGGVALGTAGLAAEKAGFKPEVEIGPTKWGPRGVGELTGVIGGGIAGPAAARAAVRGAKAVPGAAREAAAEFRANVPSLRGMLAEEAGGGLKPRGKPLWEPEAIRAAKPKPAAQAFREATEVPRQRVTQPPDVPAPQQGIEEMVLRGVEGKPMGEAVAPAGKEAALARWRAGYGKEPPRKPPATAEAAGGVTPESAGNRFVAPLREFDDVVAEVVTSENAVVRALAGRTGINPSILSDTPAGKALTAYWRQRVSSELLSEVAISPALDAHAQMFTGRMGGVLRIVNGEIQGITVRPGQSRMWQDVFSRPGDYVLAPKARAYIDDFLQVVRETEAMRVEAGLRPRSVTSKEGWFYVPRQVEGIRGIELRRPSSPKLQRVYEEAQEGAAAGIRYSNSPRGTLEIHVRAAFKEVADKQLADALEPLSITAKELVPKPVLIRMEQAVRSRLKAERAVRKLRGQERTLRAKAREVRKPETKAKYREQVDDIVAQRQEAKANVEVVKAQYWRAKNAYSRAMEAARKAEVAPGKLFGQTEDAIPIATWRNRFFPREQADALNEALGSFLRPAQKASPFARGLEVTGNYIRFLSAVGDFAEPFIQGLPTLAYRPLVWAKSALRHYQAFFDPTVQARFIRQRLETFQKMAQHGTPIGDPEFFAALTREGGFSAGKILEVLPKGAEARRLLQQGGKQTFGRFQASYNTGLGSNRALLYESLQPTWKGTEGELWQFIRNMTGGLDSRALGVGPSQRGLESVWLAFSPRLLRSTASLITDAARPGTAQGQAAFKALGGLCSAAAGIYVLTGLGLGKSWEEIGDGLNPTQGKKFLSHEINGDWVGVGGQVRAISQFMAHSISSIAPGGEPIESFVSTSQFENPVLRFYSSRGAPAMNIVGGLVEAGTGLNVLPFDQVDSGPDLLKHLGTSAMPFAIQGKLEGEQWSTTGMALVGARTSAETVYEERNKARDEAAQRMFGKPWDELPQGQQNEVRAAEPTLQELETEAIGLGAERGYDYSKRTEAYRAEKDTRAEQGERMLEADPTGREWAGWRKTVGIQLNTVWDMLTQQYGIKEEPREPKFAEDRLAERYWNLEPDANNDGLISNEEWNAYDAERKAILSEARGIGVDEEYIKHGYRGQMWPNHPQLQTIEEEYQQAKEIAHEYHSIPYKSRMPAEQQDQVADYVDEAIDIASLQNVPFRRALTQTGIPTELIGLAMRYKNLPINPARERYWRQYPEKKELYFTFYRDIRLATVQEPEMAAAGVR